VSRQLQDCAAGACLAFEIMGIGDFRQFVWEVIAVALPAGRQTAA
jgi:hypothetical protein